MSKRNELLADLGVRNVSTMPAPKKLVQPASNGMPPPLPRTMPPPPPKFTSSAHVLAKTKSDDVPGKLEDLLCLFFSFWCVLIFMGRLERLFACVFLGVGSWKMVYCLFSFHIYNFVCDFIPMMYECLTKKKYKYV